MPTLPLKRYRVEPSTDVRLGDWKPDDDGGLSREEGDAMLERNLAAMDELQMKFWANRSRSMLAACAAWFRLSSLTLCHARPTTPAR